MEKPGNPGFAWVCILIFSYLLERPSVKRDFFYMNLKSIFSCTCGINIDPRSNSIIFYDERGCRVKMSKDWYI